MKLTINKGDLLIAEPFMEDEHFKRTVTLICENDQEGALGLILNKPSIFRVNEMLDNFPAFQTHIYYGGPVGLDRINYIHAYGDILEESILIKDNIYWNGNFNQLKALIKEKKIAPNNIKFFVGFAGWDAMQLQDEVEKKDWIINTNFAKYFSNPDNMWKNALESMGGNNKLIANFPTNPIFN